MFGRFKAAVMPEAGDALPGHDEPMPVESRHYVNGQPLQPPFPSGFEQAVFGLGCFWGAERKFWSAPGVYTTAVGYAAGHTPNPTYREVCSGMTGHNEVVLVVFDPAKTSYEALLSIFWEAHNPTQGMRQGNDVGTQYRSGIYTFSPQQHAAAQASLAAYQAALQAAGYPAITTEVLTAPTFYYAEDYHQQYLAKNPGGYCGLGGTGVRCV
jgi:methionine-S-sulfoxide reductase